MASAWSEESFACPVCLDTLKDPATLPCGHSYCLACIKSHWDKGDSRGEYSCPQCRQVFSPRPSLSKSTLLVEAMEKLRTNSLKHSSSSAPPSMPVYLEVLPDTRPRQGSMYPQLPSVEPRPCPQHKQPLDLFCHEDKECVCEVCCQHTYSLCHLFTTSSSFSPCLHYQALVQALQNESTDLFSELVKNVNLTGMQVGELLSAHETSLGSQVEGQIHRMEQEVAQLRWKNEELSRLNFLIMEPLGQTGTTGESVLSQEEALHPSLLLDLKVNIKLENVSKRKASWDLTGTCLTVKTHHQLDLFILFTNALLYQCVYFLLASSVMTTGLVNPEPKTREEMIKFRFEPTMDPNTVYRHVQLSDGGHKATMKAENLNPPDHPERFQFWRQVLCREPLAGSPYYWEVEWTGQKVTIAVAYKHIERKGSDDNSRLGHNALSWSLYWSGTGFSFWHDNKEKLLGSPKSRRIGVYLDQHAGILAFYSIANNQATLIHRHKEEFSGPLYPGFRFWAGVGNTVTICQLD
uniref:Uncharacterized protein n=1 Tax=Acanthochromis polyacanthus TaxID=80966 RepID=A0A3Q1F5L0_9TELE